MCRLSFNEARAKREKQHDERRTNAERTKSEQREMHHLRSLLTTKKQREQSTNCRKSTSGSTSEAREFCGHIEKSTSLAKVVCFFFCLVRNGCHYHAGGVIVGNGNPVSLQLAIYMLGSHASGRWAGV